MSKTVRTTQRRPQWNMPPQGNLAAFLAEVERMNEAAPWTADDPQVYNGPECVALVDGRFVVTPAPHFRHSVAVRRLTRALDRLIGPRGLVLSEVGIPTRGGLTVRTPDVAVWMGLSEEQGPKQGYIKIPPDLIIEVLSQSSQAEDRGAKLEEYADIRVREYILFDPKNHAWEAFRLRRGKYSVLAKHADGFDSVVLGCRWNPAG